MNKNYFLALLVLIGIFVLSCSENDVDELSETTSLASVETEDDYQPYISSAMQEILDMIDTTTAPIPIEKLIPYLNSSNDSASGNELALLTKSSSIEVARGYDNYSTLYSCVQTVIDEVQSANFGVNAGTYYVTCKAATINLLTNGYYVYPTIYADDDIGINPDDLTQRGFHSQEVAPANAYRFTTYIWGVAFCSSGEYTVAEWIPSPRSGGEWMYASDFLIQLEWRYFAIQ